jgi:hypothetical protein
VAGIDRREVRDRTDGWGPHGNDMREKAPTPKCANVEGKMPFGRMHHSYTGRMGRAGKAVAYWVKWVGAWRLGQIPRENSNKVGI